jgi:hypothetical protein
MSGIHSFDVAQFVPRCLLECVCRDGRWKYGGGSLLEIRVCLELALSNVAVHWTVKVDMRIFKNHPIVDIRSSRRRWSTSQVLWRTAISGMWDVGVEVEDSITRRVPLEGPSGDNLRATKWSSKVSRR